VTARAARVTATSDSPAGVTMPLPRELSWSTSYPQGRRMPADASFSICARSLHRALASRFDHSHPGYGKRRLGRTCTKAVRSSCGDRYRSGTLRAKCTSAPDCFRGSCLSRCGPSGCHPWGLEWASRLRWMRKQRESFSHQQRRAAISDRLHRMWEQRTINRLLAHPAPDAARGVCRRPQSHHRQSASGRETAL
jgi:hypothetical protein